jgi:hypothetical protein
MKERTAVVAMGVIHLKHDWPQISGLELNWRAWERFAQGREGIKGERIMDRGSCRPETSTSLVREFDLS